MPTLEINAMQPGLVSQSGIVPEGERRLNVVEELAAVVSANLQRATRLRQSILQTAFSGNLFVQPPRERPTNKNGITDRKKGTEYV